MGATEGSPTGPRGGTLAPGQVAAGEVLWMLWPRQEGGGKGLQEVGDEREMAWWGLQGTA